MRSVQRKVGIAFLKVPAVKGLLNLFCSILLSWSGSWETYDERDAFPQDRFSTKTSHYTLCRRAHSCGGVSSVHDTTNLCQPIFCSYPETEVLFILWRLHDLMRIKNLRLPCTFFLLLLCLLFPFYLIQKCEIDNMCSTCFPEYQHLQSSCPKMCKDSFWLCSYRNECALYFGLLCFPVICLNHSAILCA